MMTYVDLIFGLQLAIRVFLSLPMAKSRIDREIGELRSKLVSDVVDKPQARAGLASLTCLPPHGHSREWLVKQWTAMRGMEARDEVEGKVSGTVYHVSSSE